MVAVGVVMPCCVMVTMGVTPCGVTVTVAALVVSWALGLGWRETVVIGLQKRKLAEKREGKKEKCTRG
jgi:hypothetical protein